MGMRRLVAWSRVVVGFGRRGRRRRVRWRVVGMPRRRDCRVP